MESSRPNAQWSAILDVVRSHVSGQRFQTWFQPVRVLDLKSDHLVLEVPNPFFADWFEEHNVPLVVDAFRELGCPSAPKIRLTVSDSYYEQSQNLLTAPATAARPAAAPAGGNGWSHNLYARFVFDNFVVGKANEFSNAAAHAVAQDPGMVYNPLFIYGGTGLGKTHLMQAIGHAVLAKNPNAKVYYGSSEKFMNSMIQAITAGQTIDFRKKYRNLDLLLLDDIHFLSRA